MIITHLIAVIVTTTVMPSTGIRGNADDFMVKTLGVAVGIVTVAVFMPSCYGEGISSRDANLAHIPTVENMPLPIRPGSACVPKRMLVLNVTGGGFDEVSLVHPINMHILVSILLLLPPVVELVVQVGPQSPHAHSASGNDVTITRGGRRQGRKVHRTSASLPLTARSDPIPTPHVAITVGFVVMAIDEMTINLVLAPQWPKNRGALVARTAARPGGGTLADGAAAVEDRGSSVSNKKGENLGIDGAPS